MWKIHLCYHRGKLPLKQRLFVTDDERGELCKAPESSSQACCHQEGRPSQQAGKVVCLGNPWQHSLSSRKVWPWPRPATQHPRAAKGRGTPRSLWPLLWVPQDHSLLWQGTCCSDCWQVFWDFESFNPFKHAVNDVNISENAVNIKEKKVENLQTKQVGPYPVYAMGNHWWLFTGEWLGKDTAERIILPLNAS